MGSLETLKQAAPELYARAYDDALNGRSMRAIARDLYWMIEATNEKRAMQGKSLLNVNLDALLRTAA
jgi:hypothetical protein